jgi:hypothetical protein
LYYAENNNKGVGRETRIIIIVMATTIRTWKDSGRQLQLMLSPKRKRITTTVQSTTVNNDDGQCLLRNIRDER